jgi:Lar family restriction alleviation protein
MTEELKDCPFCGGDNVHIYAIAKDMMARAECRWCKAHGPVGDAPEEAVYLWNNRRSYSSIPLSQHNDQVSRLLRQRDDAQATVKMFQEEYNTWVSRLNTARRETAKFRASWLGAVEERDEAKERAADLFRLLGIENKLRGLAVVQRDEARTWARRYRKACIDLMEICGRLVDETRRLMTVLVGWKFTK